MTTEFDDLADMAIHVRRSLHWASFLLAAMVLILLIDLQLKRSIARQAITVSQAASRIVADLKGDPGGRTEPVAEPAGDSGHSGRGGSDHVDGSTSLAEGNGQAGAPVEAAVRRHPSSRAKRSPGDG
jgi:hypothetical protein